MASPKASTRAWLVLGGPSSLNMQNADFIAGRYRFNGSSDAGQVINRAQIRTPEGGQVFLIAPRVENSGLITTPQGDVVLAAGKKVEIADTRNPRVRIEIEAPEGEALNIGKLMASGGSVGLYGRSVKAGGQISANAAVVGTVGGVPPRRAPTPAETKAARSPWKRPGSSRSARRQHHHRRPAGGHHLQGG
jgi:hypothetical protein